MREFSTPLTIEIPATGNLTDDVVTNAREAADAVVFSRKVDGEWTDVTAAGFLAEVSAVAKGLMAAGIEPGDRVALISKTRYEWTLLDYAIWFAGAVTVPVYETSSTEQIGWILADSGAKAVVAEGKEHLARVNEARQSGAGDDLNHVWSINDNAVDVLTRLGQDITDEALEAASYDGHSPRPGHADLHQRDHRSAQGLHAHPRQLHVRARRRDRRAAPPLRRRGRLDAALPAAGPRVRPHHPGRRGQEAGPRSATAPTSRTCSATSRSSSRPSSWPSRASSRRSSTAPPSAPPPTGGARSSTGPPRPPSRGPAPRTADACRCGSRRSTPSSTGSSTASSARPWAATAGTPSPAARRSATGSVTSTAASA